MFKLSKFSKYLILKLYYRMYCLPFMPLLYTGSVHFLTVLEIPDNHLIKVIRDCVDLNNLFVNY